MLNLLISPTLELLIWPGIAGSFTSQAESLVSAFFNDAVHLGPEVSRVHV